MSKWFTSSDFVTSLKKNWNYRQNFIDECVSVRKFKLSTNFTDEFLNFNYRRKNTSVTHFIYRQKNSSVKFVNNSNFFNGEICRRIEPLVKETGNFPLKLYFWRIISSIKFVDNFKKFYRWIYRRIYPSVKEARNFSPKFAFLTDFSVGTYVT